MFEAGYLAVSLNSTQVCPTPVDHRLWSVTPGSHILIRSHHYRHIHIGCQVSIDSECLQVMCNTVAQLCRILYISRLICFESTRTIPIDIHNTLDKAPLLVGGDQQRHPGFLLHTSNIVFCLIKSIHLGAIHNHPTCILIVDHRLQVV